MQHSVHFIGNVHSIGKGKVSIIEHSVAEDYIRIMILSVLRGPNKFTGGTGGINFA